MAHVLEWASILLVGLARNGADFDRSVEVAQMAVHAVDGAVPFLVSSSRRSASGRRARVWSSAATGDRSSLAL